MSYTKKPTSFEEVHPVYQTYNVRNNAGTLSVDLGAKIYVAKPTVNSEPIYVLDNNNIIHSKKTAIVIKPVAGRILDSLFTQSNQKFMQKQIQSQDPRIEDWGDVKTYACEADYAFNDTMLPDFFDSKAREPTAKWKELVRDVVSYNCTKDPSLALADRAMVPRSFVMAYAPHRISITPPSCGKSTFGAIIGAILDKLTSKSLLGGAKWRDDKVAGIFHDQYFTVTIDQPETQQVENILGFALGFLESGEAGIGGGGILMKIKGACPIMVCANPRDLKGNHSAVFREIITLLCTSTYPLGRRIGLLTCGNYAPLINHGYDDMGHKDLMAVYRALEERSVTSLTEFWNQPKVKDFCSKPVYDLKGTDIQLDEKVKAYDVVEIRSFLRAHLDHGHPHLRGGAINLAITDHLPALASRDAFGLGEMAEITTKILKSAEEYTASLKAIDKASIEYVFEE